MPLDLTTLNRHLTTLVGDLPVSFTHKGTIYGPAGVTRSKLREDQKLMLGGLDAKLDSILYVKASVLGAATIAIGDQIFIGSERLTVHDLDRSADAGQLVKLTLAWLKA